MPATLARNDRCMAICRVLPAFDSPRPSLSVQDLLLKLAEDYEDCQSEKGRLRAIQRDLKQLCEADKIVRDTKKGEGKTLRYRLAEPDAEEEQSRSSLSYVRSGLAHLGIPTDLAELVVAKMRGPASLFDLPADQFRVVADNVRLMPRMPVDVTIQQEIVTALRRRRALKIIYRKNGEAERERVLHPIGAILRGPQYYLIALDAADRAAGETIPKMFLFNRIVDALVLEEPFQVPSGVTLESTAQGKAMADFVRDPTPVRVRLRVRDYVRTLLEENVLASNQRIEPEANGDSAIVTAHLPLSGTLYRWVLGFGDKMEVLEPESLRRAVACQAQAITRYYGGILEAGDDDDEEGDARSEDAPAAGPA